MERKKRYQTGKFYLQAKEKYSPTCAYVYYYINITRMPAQTQSYSLTLFESIKVFPLMFSKFSQYILFMQSHTHIYACMHTQIHTKDACRHTQLRTLTQTKSTHIHWCIKVSGKLHKMIINPNFMKNFYFV